MSEKRPHNLFGRMKRRFAFRGESLIGSLGFAGAAILIAALAASAAWNLRAQRQTAVAARVDHLRATAGFLAQAAESMLASGELSALRRLVVEARRASSLASCRITLPDGGVVADSEPVKINVAALPKRWSAGPLDAAESPGNGSMLTVTRSLLVPGRGGATLTLTADPGVGWKEDADVRAGVGLIGVSGLMVLLVVYRQMRLKALTLGMIRDALLAVDGGERAAEALMIGGHPGREANAWNTLLQERDALRRRDVGEQARGLIDRRRESRGEMELACESLSVGLVILDAQGIVRHANGAAASLLRTGREELAGSEVATRVEHPELREALKELAAGGVVRRRNFELSMVEQGEKSVLRIGVRPLRRDDASAVLITIEDVTQQRVADESRHSFVAQATHELRTPLTNMRLCLETALEDGKDDPVALNDSLNVLNRETRRLERMVTEILSVAEIEAGSLKLRADDVRLDALFDTLRSDLVALATEKGQMLAFELPPKLPVIQGDRDKLLLTLHNLIGNAIKYTPEGGRVVVTVKADAHQVSVDVADTGIGIKPEEQSLVFDKFYRSVDPRVAKVTGSGLGLALAREVARLHRGDVTVQSEPDKGSVFTLVVPLAA
jgi:PAS domain S-box-containing protein